MNPKPEQTLTPREFETVRTLVDSNGDSDREIGKRLGVKLDTVKAHLMHARNKTGIDRRTGLVMWFMRKYPTEQDRNAGMIDACLYRCSRKSN